MLILPKILASGYTESPSVLLFKRERYIFFIVVLDCVIFYSILYINLNPIFLEIPILACNFQYS